MITYFGNKFDERGVASSTQLTECEKVFKDANEVVFAKVTCQNLKLNPSGPGAFTLSQYQTAFLISSHRES